MIKKREAAKIIINLKYKIAHYSRVDKEDEEAAKGVRKRERFGRGLILQLREAIFVLFIAIRYIKLYLFIAIRYIK